MDQQTYEEIMLLNPISYEVFDHEGGRCRD
jgi:hypothetical protein